MDQPTIEAPAPETGVPATGTPAEPATPAQPAPSPDVAALQAELDRWKHQARSNEQRAKANADQAKLLDKVAEALGIKTPETGPADVAQRLEGMLAQAKQIEQRARQRELRAVVGELSGELGAQAAAVWDSASFQSRIANVDPSDAEAIRQAITATVGASPWLASAPKQPAKPAPPSASGAELNGAPGGQRQWTADDVAKASPEAVSKAMQQGLLKNYLNS